MEQDNKAIRVSNFEKIPRKTGLHDDGHIILSCSSCGENLVDIWIVKKDALNPKTGKKFRWKGKAMCWACGDASFPQEWEGRYALGHYGEDKVDPDPDSMNDSKVTSIVTKIEPVGDMLIFHTKKSN